MRRRPINSTEPAPLEEMLRSADAAIRNEDVEAALDRADKVCRRRKGDGDLIAYLPSGKATAVKREHLETTFALGVLAEEVRRLRSMPRAAR